MSNDRITTRMKGRWTSVLPMLGVPAKILDGKHHPCPRSGEGEDRFRFSNKGGKGNFFCACNDGRGDGFKLLNCMFDWDFRTAATNVESVIGESSEDAEDAKKAEHAIRDLRAIQREVVSRRSDEWTRQYLAGRGIDLERVYRPGVLHDGFINYGLKKIGIQNRMQAMVAKYVTAAGKPSTFHLTYLEQGKKAKIERDRVVATPVEPMQGGAVRLHPLTAAGILGVAEGIETALSAAQLHGFPVWATLNAAMLEKFEPPKQAHTVIVFADNDTNYTGQAAAYALAKRLVLKNGIAAEVRMPLRAGDDWNDVLVRGGVL